VEDDIWILFSILLAMGRCESRLYMQQVLYTDPEGSRYLGGWETPPRRHPVINLNRAEIVICIAAEMNGS